MRNRWTSLVVAFCLLGATSCSNKTVEWCFPENDLYISADSKTLSMSEETFNHVIDVVEEIYKPIVAEQGGELQVERKWEDGTVNAYAQRVGKIYKVSMFGGLARHNVVTPDGFALVVCHEIGHHIGGAPKKSGWGGLTWASNEGQADYWGSSKCMKKVIEVLEETPEDKETEDYKFAEKECEKQYESQEDQHTCTRASMAGKSLAELFRALRNQAKEIHFWTKDTTVVTTTNHNHPASQCRMDTYFSGALCNKSPDAEVSNTDAKKGFCSLGEDAVETTRPLCWFKP